MIQQCPKIHFGQKFFNILSADTPSATRIDVTSCNNNILKGHALEPRHKENASNTIFYTCCCVKPHVTPLIKNEPTLFMGPH